MGRATAIADHDGAKDQVIVLSGISWAQYEGLLRARDDHRVPLMAYLDGELELVTVSREHELVKKLLARLVEAFAEEHEIELTGLGNATIKKKAKRAGCEPDEWYCIDGEKDSPDLAIEVVYTSGGVDKLEIYRRFGAREVWFWNDGRIHVYALVEGTYQARARSVALAGIDLRSLERIVSSADPYRQTGTVRAFRRSLRRRS